MKEIKKDTKVTLVTVTPGELLIAPLGLKYPISHTVKGVPTTTQLVFVEGRCQIDKEENKELYEAVKKLISEQYADEQKKVLKAGKMKLPFVLFEDFEATLATTPQRVEMNDGKVYEATPDEIKEALELLKNKKEKTK